MADEISNSNINIDNNQISIFNQANKDKLAIELFINDYKKVEREIKKVDSQEYMVADTDIKLLQENYNYYLWTILAIGFVIVGIHIIKKKPLF
jgi:preprotein translocase subunit Sss1